VTGQISSGSPKWTGRLLTFVWGLILVCGFVAPPVVWLSLVGLALLIASLGGVAARSWRVTLLPVAAVLAVATLFGAVSFSRYREFVALLEKNPAVSVANRLAYEIRGSRQAAGQTTTPLMTDPSGGEDTPLPEPIGAEVKRLEDRLYDWNGDDGRWSRRAHALARLQSLHRRMVYDFTIAEGFGVGRMFPKGVRREAIEIPELPGVTVPESSESPAGETPSLAAGVPGGPGDADAPAASRPDYDALRAAHEAGVVDFANRTGFGYIASREQVFGFQSHGFRNLPEIGGEKNAPPRWHIARLELVSLLKHETPVAYVSLKLPRMDELAAAATRPLDQFERDALQELRDGKELVVAEDGHHLRMLGSLRAAKQCTECHSVARGALLGAFTYWLRKDAAGRRQPAVRAKQVL
jgi:hypothetical protein